MSPQPYKKQPAEFELSISRLIDAPRQKILVTLVTEGMPD
jgi:hypothetical protein